MRKKFFIITVSALLGVCVGGSIRASAEDLNVIFKKVGELVEQKNYPGAISELSWAKEELEKLHQARLKEDRKSTRLNSSHVSESRMPSSA